MANRNTFNNSKRKYQCKFCTKCFTRSSVLTDHIRVHTGEKPFQCKTCLRSFSQLANLSRHYKIHADVQTLKCKYCNETFSHLASLLVHETTHATQEDITPLAYPAVPFSNQTGVHSSLNTDSIRAGNDTQIQFSNTNVNSVNNTIFHNSNAILVSDESEDSLSFDQQMNENSYENSCQRDKLELSTDVSAESKKYFDDKLERENSSFDLSLKIPTDELQVIEIKPDISPLSVPNSKLLSVNKTINTAENFNSRILQMSSSNQSDLSDCQDSKNFDIYENTENLSGNIQYFKSENELFFKNSDLNVIPRLSAEPRSLNNASLPGSSSSFHFDHSDSFNAESGDMRRNDSNLNFGQLNVCHSSSMKINQDEELVIENQKGNNLKNEDYIVIPHEISVNGQIENNDSSDIIVLNPSSSPKSTSQPENPLTYFIPQENQVTLDLNKSSISKSSYNGNDEDVFITCESISGKSFQEERNNQFQSDFNRMEELSVERVSEDVSIVIESVFSMKEDLAKKCLLSSADDVKHLEISDENKTTHDVEMINLVDFPSNKLKCDEQPNWSVPLVDIQEISRQNVDTAETMLKMKEAGIKSGIVVEANLPSTNILDISALKTEFQQPVLELAPRSQQMTKNQSKTKKFNCKFCDKSFSQGSVLLKHIETHTEGKAPFLCDLCRQPFARLTNLNQKRNDHFRNKMLHCQFCQRTFPCLFQLLNHLKYHARSIQRNIKTLEDKIARRKTEGKVLLKRTQKVCKKSLKLGTSTNRKYVKMKPQNIHLSKKDANQENDPKSLISDLHLKRSTSDPQLNAILSENDENFNPQYLGNRERKKNLHNEKGINSVEVCENLTINSSSDSVVDNMNVEESVHWSNKTYEKENMTEIPVLVNSSNEQNNIKSNFGSFTRPFTSENNLSSNILEHSRTENKSLQDSLIQNEPIERVSQIEYIEHLPQNDSPVPSFSVSSPQNTTLSEFAIKLEHPFIHDGLNTIQSDCSATTGINFQKVSKDENITEDIFETSKCAAGSSYNNSSNEPLKSGQFHCKFCNKSFSRKFILTKHLRTHTGEKPYKCEFCPRLFSQLNNLNQHRKSHMSLGLFPCKICPSKFENISELNVHNKKLHAGMKPYICKFCSKMFSRSSVLREHIRTHTGEKPYICELCNRAFSQSTNLNRHMKVHVPGRVFRCRNCSYTFKQYWHFKRHMKTHNSGRTSNDEAFIRKIKRPYSRTVLQISSRRTKPSNDLICKIPDRNENNARKNNGLFEEKTENMEPNKDSHFVTRICDNAIQCDALKTNSYQDCSNLQPFQETVPNIATRTPTSLSMSGQLFSATNSFPLTHLEMQSVATPMQLVPNLCHKSFQQNLSHVSPEKGDGSSYNKAQSNQPFLLTSVQSQTPLNKSFSLVKKSSNLLLDNHETVDESLENEDAKTLVNSVNSLSVINVKLEPDDVTIENQSEVIPKLDCFDSVYRSQSAVPFKEFPCIFCNKLFHHSQVLCRHLRSHHKSEMMLSSTCQLCRVSFPDSDALVRHRKTCSQLMLPYFCNLCKEKFPNSSELNQHRQRKHSGGVKRYSCRYCTKVFARNSVLTEHIRTHTGERPFVCELCLRPFSQATNLKRHQKTHAKNGAFVCKYCKASFNEFTLLSRHLRMHVEERKFIEQNRMKSKTRPFPIKVSPTIQITPEQVSETLANNDVNKSINVSLSNVKPQKGVTANTYEIENITEEVVLEGNKSRISETVTMNKQRQTALVSSDAMRANFRSTEIEQIGPMMEESSLCYHFSERDAGKKSRVTHQDDLSVIVARKTQDVTSNFPISSSQTIFSDTVPPIFHDQSIGKDSSDISNQSFININSPIVKLEDNQLGRNPSSQTCDKVDAQSYDFGNIFNQQTIPSITPTPNIRLHTFISSAEREPDSFVSKPYQTLDFEKKHQLNSLISARSLVNAKIYSTKTNMSHICKFCKCSFPTSRQLLYHHQLKHLRKKSHQCKYCNRFFARTNVLTEHIRTHTGEKPFVCNVCSKAFSQLTNLKRHQKIHDRKTITCRYCKAVFTDYSLLLKHMRSHGKSQEKHPKSPTSNVPASCDIVTNISDRIKNRSPQSVQKDMSNLNANERCLSDTNPNPFVIDSEQIFTSNNSSYSDSLDAGYSATYIHPHHFSEVKKHRHAHPDQASHLNETKLSRIFPTHNIEPIPQTAVDKSGDGIIWSNDLISGKNEQQRKEIQHCINSESNGSQLNKFSSSHISHSNSSNNAKKYSCRYCEDSFIQITDLHAHMSICNDREKCHRCKYCNRAFGRSSVLKQHIRIHTGEKPFKCDKCSQCFTQSIHLKRHTKKHSVDNQILKNFESQKRSNLRSFSHGLHKQLGYYRKSALRKYNKKLISEKSSDLNLEIKFPPLSNPRPTDELSFNASTTQCDSVQTTLDKSITINSTSTMNDTEVILSELNSLKQQSKINDSVVIPSSSKNQKSSEANQTTIPLQPGISTITADSNFRPTVETINSSTAISSFNEPIDCDRYASNDQRRDSSSAKRLHICKICKEVFPNRLKLSDHFKSHSKKLFQCTFCDKGFTRSSVLKEHIRTHTGEKPFNCIHCRRSFSQMTNLKRHLKVHNRQHDAGSSDRRTS